MADYIRIGDPANEAEREGFRLLRDFLPDHYLILGNFDLRLPGRRSSLEFDAVVIGEYGFYAVEIKGWTGHIRGDVRDWYVPWGRVSNPLNFLEKKTKALAHFVRSQMPGLSEEIFFTPVLFFPRRDAILELPADLRRFVVCQDEIYEHFVDMELVRSHGPGPFRSRERRQEVLNALVEIAEPPQGGVLLPFYNVDAELESGNRRYREFVGSHQYLKNRSKVRIKAYAVDALASPGARQREQRRILRDMEALEALDGNPYVARPYEMQPDYQDSLILYLVSEWMGQRTLATCLDEYREREIGPIYQWRSLGYHLVEAISSIHQAGIVHRNLSPEVIYLTEDEQPVPLKVADFDFAWVRKMEPVADDLYQAGAPGYAAPELRSSGAVDPRVDLFALGAMLFALVTGRRLFERTEDEGEITRVWEERKSWIKDEELQEIVGGLVSPQPQRRVEAMERARSYFADQLDG